MKKGLIINYKFTLAFLLMLCFSCAGLLAQTRTIEGVISNEEDGQPLIGASVSIKGTTIGSITDSNGKYSIQVNSAQDILVYSYVGYITEEVAVGNQSTINLTLSLNLAELDEVIVIGYGVQKKSDLTGAITMVSAEELENTNSSTLSAALQGKTSGMSILSTSGRPGATASIRVRGIGSLTNEAQPLVVIDGIQSSSGALSSMNPQDIESISVLKDAASATIYGASSSNGVILITTKKGKSGEPSITFNSQIGLSRIPKQMDILDADQYVDYYTEAYNLHNTRFIDPIQQKTFPLAYTDSARTANNNTNTHWQDLITNKKALNQNYYFAVNGGTDFNTYMFSANYIKDMGILQTTNRDQISLRANGTQKVGKRIQFSENISVVRGGVRGVGSTNGNAWIMSAVTSPLLPVYNPDAIKGYQGPDPDITGPNERTNPLAELMLNENTSESNSIAGTFSGEYEIFSGLKIKSVLGINYFTLNGTSWSPRYDLFQRGNQTASLSETAVMNQSMQWDQLLSYIKSFGNHSINLLAGHSMTDANNKTISGNASDYRWENLRTINNGDPEFNSATGYKSRVTSESYFGRLIYDYKEKYLVTATIRRDASSKFGREYRWGTFPAVSVGWKINEDFFRNATNLDLLKLRMGYGSNGNTPDASYLYETYISTYLEHVYILGDNVPIFGAAPFYSFGSPQLRWEASEMANIGLDLAAFSNRLQVSAEFYNKQIRDIIMPLPLRADFGLSNDATPPLVNQGDMRNRGIEITASFRGNIQKLFYTLSGNFSSNKNTVLLLPQGKQFNAAGTNLAWEGHSAASYWGWVAERILQEDDFAQDENGNLIVDETGRYTPLVPKQEDYTAPGDIKFKDLNHDGKITANDQTIIGKPIPDITYGFSIDLNYGMFDLNAVFAGVHNMHVYNGYRARAGSASGDPTTKDENKLTDVLDYWTSDNPVNDQTRIALTDFNNNTRMSSWWIEDASFLRLRNLQLGVTLPSNITKTVNISNLRIYIGGENLFILTKYSGYDPEIASRNPLGDDGGLVDDGKYPNPRIFTCGINVNF